MKTRLIVGVVLVVHCVAVGSLVVVQGCRSHGVDGSGGTMPEPVPEQELIASPVVSPVPVVLPEPIVQPEVEARTTPYIVQPGDSLSVIAQRFKLSVNEIMLINPKIKKANDIRAGQKLMLPGEVDIKAFAPVKKTVKKESAPKKATEKAAGKDTVAKAPEAAPAVSGDGSTYVVQSGDCLSKIASRNKTTSAAIKKANNLKSDALKVGQKLVLPAADAAAPVTTTPVAASPTTTTQPPVDAAPVAAPAPAVPAEVKKADATVPPALDSEPVTTTTDEGDADVVPPVDAPAPAGQTLFKLHKVDQGEDLTMIAKHWAVPEAEIKKANGMTDSTVTPGQELKIPALVTP